MLYMISAKASNTSMVSLSEIVKGLVCCIFGFPKADKTYQA